MVTFSYVGKSWYWPPCSATSPGPNVLVTVQISTGVDFGLECFCAIWRILTGSHQRCVEVDQRSSFTAVFAVCVYVYVCVCVCVVGVGPLLWQSPGRTAGYSPCGGAQGSLSQQDLVTSKDWGKGKHSAEVPLSAGLRAHTQTRTQRQTAHTLGHPSMLPQRTWLLSVPP